MLGCYVSGFGTGWNYPLFAAAIAAALPMAYMLMGATWLVMKTEGALQARAVQWAKTAWAPMIGGLVLISMATPWISATVRERWFALPEVIALMAIPLMTLISLLAVRGLLNTRLVRGLPRWLAALGLVVGAACIGHEVALQTGLSRLRDAAERRLDMLATGLEADLSRFDYLPALLEMTPLVPALLDAPVDGELREAVSRYLKGVNATAGAEMRYVLDPAGTSLAASEWQQPRHHHRPGLVVPPVRGGRHQAGAGPLLWRGHHEPQAGLLPLVRAAPRRTSSRRGGSQGRHRRRRTHLAQAAGRRAAARRARGGDPRDAGRAQVPAAGPAGRRPAG
jgi:hypothetical protein